MTACIDDFDKIVFVYPITDDIYSVESTCYDARYILDENSHLKYVSTDGSLISKMNIMHPSTLITQIFGSVRHVIFSSDLFSFLTTENVYTVKRNSLSFSVKGVIDSTHFGDYCDDHHHYFLLEDHSLARITIGCDNTITVHSENDCNVTSTHPIIHKRITTNIKLRKIIASPTYLLLLAIDLDGKMCAIYTDKIFEYLTCDCHRPNYVTSIEDYSKLFETFDTPGYYRMKSTSQIVAPEYAACYQALINGNIIDFCIKGIDIMGYRIAILTDTGDVYIAKLSFEPERQRLGRRLASCRVSTIPFTVPMKQIRLAENPVTLRGDIMLSCISTDNVLYFAKCVGDGTSSDVLSKQSAGEFQVLNVSVPHMQLLPGYFQHRGATTKVAVNE